jgi:hypothetical protein
MLGFFINLRSKIRVYLAAKGVRDLEESLSSLFMYVVFTKCI